MSIQAKHFVVSGRVQGVWFRANTQKEAQALGLTGWVRNLPDGGVEVFACGDEDKIHLLEEWLWVGPPLATVTEVKVESVAPEQFSSFDVR